MTTQSSQHLSHRLFAELCQLKLHATGVMPVPKQIQGTSFFPGGVGLWVDQIGNIPPFPVGGVMILGHDFHSFSGYEASRKAGKESDKSPTWKNLIELLQLVSISTEQCFYTNAYMGLREGSKTTGKFPGASSEIFKQKCQQFFLHQTSVQKPSLIVSLGGHVPLFLAPLSKQLRSWENTNRFSDRDCRNLSLIDNVTFDGCDAPPCVVTSILHPSYRKANIHRRQWSSFQGDEAEIAMLKQAWLLAQGKLQCPI